MLGFFPEPYDDELLFSVLGRYHLMSGNRSYKSTLTDLFQIDTVRGVVDLPSHLNRLSNTVQCGVFQSPLEIVENHTLFPYYGSFLASETARSVLDSMIGDDGNSIRTQSGIVAGSVSTPGYLKSCPQCRSEDERHWGQAYWHRVHQIPGVLMCPEHAAPLQNSVVHYTLRVSIQKFDVLSSSSISPVVHYPVEWNANLLFIAKQARWLLDHRLEFHQLSDFRKFYVQCLHSLGYVTEHGTVRFRKLIPSFGGFFGHAFLDLMDSDIWADDQDTWLHKVLRKPRVSCHPLRHTLLLAFLGESMSSMFLEMKTGAATKVVVEQNTRTLDGGINRSEGMRGTLVETLQGKREEWRIHVTGLPTASRAELRKSQPALYAWLYRHDRPWLMENMPQPKRGSHRNNRVNWKQRDLQIASEILEAVARLKSISPPVRVTVSRVGKEIGRLSLLEQHLDKLPRCKELLEKSTETIEIFRIRRVHSTAEDLRGKSEELVKWKLERQAGLRPDYGAAVEHCIIQELEMGNGEMGLF